MIDTITDYRARVMGCWLGIAIGGTLGLAFPKYAALYRTLFGGAGPVKKPTTKNCNRPSGRVMANNTR